MVLQRRLDYGFSGYQVPPTPRAPRSARRRGSFRKKIDGNQMCAFDLLATVAGKLLLEGEHSPSSIDTLTGKEQCAVLKDSVRKEHQGEENTLKVIPCDQESRDRTSLISELEIGNFANKVDVASSGCGVSFCCKLDDENKKQIKIEPPIDGKVSISANANMCSSEDPVLWDRNPPALVGSDNSRSPHDDVKLVIRDDDENSSWCTQPSTVNKAFKPPPRIGDRRIRKILASKYWKVTPKLNDKEHFNPDAEIKPVFRNRKNCFKRQRSLRDYPFKKRKFYDRGSISNSDGGISCDAISISPGKGSNGDASGLCATTHGATGTSAIRADQRASFQPSDSHVKLKIKSFRVPELFIEIPESATVGSLKRTVMDAVTAILSGGLRVGVLLQGKKIRDDNKTLLQTGISHDNKMDALGFTLEPNPLQAPPPLCTEERSFLLPCETPQPLTRYSIAPSVVQQGASDTSADHLSTNLGSLIESDHDSAPSPADMSMDKSVMDSRALVGVPAMNVEALAVVPVQKSRRPDVGQRRIRRPFSVSEVEALVQAVEKLGTGRWRDVKLRAFDNAKQRTYVDLKDKWKTLVHTARISPQQRRGEPVPQELLDRVLTAHAYWSKQQLKHQSEVCCSF